MKGGDTVVVEGDIPLLNSEQAKFPPKKYEEGPLLAQDHNPNDIGGE